MATMDQVSVAEGLALVAEGVTRLEAATTASDRQTIADTVRVVLRKLVQEAGYPEALSWPTEPQWVSLFTE